MITTLQERLSQELSNLGARSRLRTLKPASGIDFTSNDYLGLSRHPALAQAVREALARGPVGSGGSRLLGGNRQEHEELEEAAARFFRAESALYFNSGFDANLALISALPSRRAGLVIDEQVHASVKEGARASFAKKYVARHNDLASFEEALKKARRAGARDLYLAIESVYSMEGDAAPVGDILTLARSYEATVLIDEAHATGVFGDTGRGLSEGRQGPGVIALHTCGKALGASGALVVADRVVKEYLINTARPFLYSTASSPLLAAVVRRALALIDEESWRRKRLLQLAQSARLILSSALSRWGLGGAGTQILPILISGDAQTLQTAEALQARGFDVRAIRPPTVPASSCRLRLSLNVERTEDDVRALAAALKEIETHAQ